MEDKKLPLDALIEAMMLRHLFPGEWFIQVAPWERLIKEPRWMHAKGLVDDHLERVSVIVEVLVPRREFATDHRCWVCLGKVRAKQKNWDGAIDAFQRALQHSGPENVKAWYNIALVYQEQGLQTEALEAVRSGLAEQRSDRRLRALLEALVPADSEPPTIPVEAPQPIP